MLRNLEGTGNSEILDDSLNLLKEVSVENLYDELKQENPDITRLIEQRKAAYTCEVTCPRTYLRRCYKSEKPEFEIELGRREVFVKVEFYCFVTVYEEIDGYHNEFQNEDYGDASFDMEPGDVLVSFPTAYVPVDITYEMLYSSGACMVVLDGGQDTKHTWFDANDDTIKVYLPHDMFEQYRTMHQNRNFNALFHASIVFNALFKVLSEYKESVHGNYLWAEAVKTRIDTDEDLREFDIKDTSRAYELAQGILGDPYKRLFNHLQDMQDRNE